MNGGGAIALIIGFAVLIIVLGILKAIAERKRRDALAALARELGFSFSPDHDSHLASRLGFLDKLDQGSDRYAFNQLEGELNGERVLIFDYHYETYSRDSKGRRQTHHHYLSFFVLFLPANFPELTITREGFFDKLKQAFGFDDIDFESHEFSRRFKVQSRDKRFAYDVCNARMIEYLLENQDLVVEIDGEALAFCFDSTLTPGGVRRELRRLEAVRELLPDYLFSDSRHA